MSRLLTLGIVSSRKREEEPEVPTGPSYTLSWVNTATEADTNLIEESDNGIAWSTVESIPAGAAGSTTEYDVYGDYNTGKFYRVAAVNAFGSEPALEAGMYYFPIQNAITSPSVTLIDSNTVSFDGTSDAPVNGGYRVEYHKTGETAFFNVVESSTKPVVIGGLEADSQYNFRGYTYNLNDDGTRSYNPVSSTVVETTLGYAGFIDSFVNKLFYARLGEAEGIDSFDVYGADGIYLPNDGTEWTGGTLANPGALIANASTSADFVRAVPGTANYGARPSMNGLTELSICGWFKPGPFADNNYGQLIKKEFAVSDSVAVYLGGPGYGNSTRIFMRVQNGSDSYGVTDTDFIVDANYWYFIAVVYNGAGVTNSDKLKIYLNCQLQGIDFTGTIPATLPTNAADLIIGHSIQGKQQDWAIFNSLLTQGNLESLYAASGRTP